MHYGVFASRVNNRVIFLTGSHTRWCSIFNGRSVLRPFVTTIGHHSRSSFNLPCCARAHVHLAHSACCFSSNARSLVLSLFSSPLHFLPPPRLRSFNNDTMTTTRTNTQCIMTQKKKQYNARFLFYCVFVAALERLTEKRGRRDTRSLTARGQKLRRGWRGGGVVGSGEEATSERDNERGAHRRVGGR